MIKIPFNVYDFFAYLSSGAVLAAAVDYAYGSAILVQKDVPTLLLLGTLLLCYALGHFVSQLGAFIVEHWFARSILKPPFENLFNNKEISCAKRLLFPGYCSPIPEATLEKVKSRANQSEVDSYGEELFYHIYQNVTRTPRAAERIDLFLNMYSFSRNFSTGLGVSTVILFGAKFAGKPINIWVPICGIVLSVTFFYRFLKFYRIFSVELLRNYAEPLSNHKEGA